MLMDIVAVTDDEYRNMLGDTLILSSALDLSLLWVLESTIPYLWISSPYCPIKKRFDISTLFNSLNSEYFLNKMNTSALRPSYLCDFFESLTDMMGEIGYAEHWDFREYILSVFNHAMSKIIDGYPKMVYFNIWLDNNLENKLTTTKIDKKGVHIWNKMDKQEYS